MFGELKRLGRETLIYGLSTVAGRALNFLLLPLYTHCLSPSDYGVVATLFAYLAFGSVLYAHGMDFAFMRHAGEEDGREFSTSFWSLAGAACLLSLGLHAFAEPARAALGLPEGSADLVRYGAWILAFDALALIPFAELRLSHRAGVYAGIKAANIAMNLALNYVFLVVLRLGVRGVFLASLVTAAATFVMVSPVLAGRLRAVFDKGLHRALLRFALPLVPAGLASMSVQVIDRPILKYLTDDATVGLYQANYRLGIVMMMVVNMFDAAWRPFFLEKKAAPDADKVLARVLTYFAFGASLVFLAMTFFVDRLVAIPLPGGRPLIHPAYWGGLAVVPVVTLGYLFNGFYVNFLAPVTLAKRSELVAYATAAGAAVNVAANFALIPRLGMMGAAWATLAAYAAMAGALYFFGRRVRPIDYEWGRLARLGAAVALAVLAFQRFDGPSAHRDLLRLGLLLAVPGALAAAGFFDARERAAFKEWLRPSGGPAAG